MRWPGIEQLYGPTLRQSPVFASGSQLGKKTGAKATEKKTDELENPGQLRWEELHKRVIEHVGLVARKRLIFRISGLLHPTIPVSRWNA